MSLPPYVGTTAPIFLFPFFPFLSLPIRHYFSVSWSTHKPISPRLEYCPVSGGSQLSPSRRHLTAAPGTFFSAHGLRDSSRWSAGA